MHASQLGLTHIRLLGLCSLAGDVRPSLMPVLITVEVNARLGCSHPVSPAPCFPSTQTSACDTRGSCVRAFPGAARLLDASTPGQSGGYQTVAGCTPAPPPSHGRPMRGVRDLAFSSWHFWAGLQGVTQLYTSLARRLSSALLPPSPQAERDSCVGFCLQPAPPILPSSVTRASPWPLWELGFCLWDEGAQLGKP